MYRSIVRRGATLGVAALACAALAAPVAQAEPLNPASLEFNGVPIDAEWVQTSVASLAMPITDPVGSLEGWWQIIDCFVEFPGDDPMEPCFS